jgi:hypothetical protein
MVSYFFLRRVSANAAAIGARSRLGVFGSLRSLPACDATRGEVPRFFVVIVTSKFVMIGSSGAWSIACSTPRLKLYLWKAVPPCLAKVYNQYCMVQSRRSCSGLCLSTHCCPALRGRSHVLRGWKRVGLAVAPKNIPHEAFRRHGLMQVGGSVELDPDQIITHAIPPEIRPNFYNWRQYIYGIYALQVDHAEI